MKCDPGTRPAFVDLVHQHQGALRRISSVYSRSPEDREDLEQEILMQAWRAFPSFRGDSAFSTWFYRVALNTALTRTRGEARRPAVATEDMASVEAARSGEEDDSEIETLRGCIRELPTLDRAIVVLSLERKSYDEIAEITGLTRGNISVRLVRIKDRLRRRLAAKGIRGG